MKLYPLKFQPIFKYRIWGGNKIKNVLNKNIQYDSIGESWEISGVQGDETIVSEGELQGESLSNLIKKFKGDFLGTDLFCHFGEEFPLLIKFIDAQTPLSIQVHPNNDIAKKRHNSFGKNEMWYIMEADKDAELIVGFKEKCNSIDFQNRINDNEVLQVLNTIKVTEGDTFYIPAGRIHAIGAGVLLAEIQQTSDVTYRVYDYDRVDQVTGEKRKLHVKQAIDVIDYGMHDLYETNYESLKNVSNKLVHSPYFKSNLILLEGDVVKDYSKLDSFIIYICVEGAFNVVWNDTMYNVRKGETLLLPAAINKVVLTSTFAKVIEVYV